MFRNIIIDACTSYVGLSFSIGRPFQYRVSWIIFRHNWLLYHIYIYIYINIVGNYLDRIKILYWLNDQVVDFKYVIENIQNLIQFSVSTVYFNRIKLLVMFIIMFTYIKTKFVLFEYNLSYYRLDSAFKVQFIVHLYIKNTLVGFSLVSHPLY